MFFVLALLIGGGAILFGLLTLKRQNALRKACTAQTAGVVVRVDKQVRTETYEVGEDEMDDREDKDKTTRTREVTTYYPVFSFSAGEHTIEKTGSIGTGSPKFRTGQNVSVFYNPNAPEEFYVAEDASGSTLGIILIAAGAVVIIAGLVTLFL